MINNYCAQKLGLILSCFVAAGCASAQCVLTEDAQQMIMENEYLKLTIQADKGAGGSALMYKKTGDGLTSWPENGIMLDRFWIAGQNTDFYLTPYSGKALEKSPQKVSVVFSCPARSPGFTDLVLEKTITLESKKSFVDVRLKLTNNGKKTLPIGMWAFQDLRVPGKTNMFYAPTALGVEVVRHYPMDGGKKFEFKGEHLEGADRFLYNFSRGWTGVIADNGVGATCLMQPEQVSCLYNWFGEALNSCTVEWIYNRFELLPGKTWETRYAILPLSGLKSLDGAGANMAGGIVADKFEKGKTAAVRAQIISGEEKSATVALLMKRLPETEFKKIAQKEVKLQADQPAEVAFEVTADQDGTAVLRFEIRAGNQLLFDMERPVVVGEASGAYTFARNFTSVGQEMPLFKKTAVTSLAQSVPFYYGRGYLDHKLSMEYATPHVKWCRPYHGGKINVLFSAPLSGNMGVRQIIEIAQRMDLDFDAVIHYGGSEQDKKRVCAYEEDEWNKKLADKLNCLVMSSVAWPLLTDEIQTAVLKKAQEGMGLVFVISQNYPQWRAKQNEDPLYALWQTSTNVTSEFTVHIPLDVMPRFQEKEMVKFAGHGNGKVFFIRYQRADKSCPFVPSLTADYKPRVLLDEQGFPMEEYGYSLLAKIILAAAGKAPDVTVTIPMAGTNAASDLAKGTLDTLIQSPKAFPAEVSLRVIDRFNNELINQKKEVAVQAGQTKVSFPSQYLSGGLHVMDVQVKDKAGKVVTWASKSLMVTTPVRLSQFKIPGTNYLDGETIEGTVAVEGTAPGNEKLFVSCELWDNLGRLMARERSEVAGLAGTKEMPVRLKVVYPMANQLWVTVNLYQGERKLDEARQEIFTRPRDRAAFHTLACAEFSQKRIREFGFSGVIYESIESLRQNLETYTWQAVPNIYVNFDDSDATGTIRNPCLTDPQFLAKVRADLKPHIEKNKQYHFIGYMFADEWKYGGRHMARPALCHSPSCLKGYREYLQGKYKTIETLNAAWQSKHASFDEIEPILPSEVNERVEAIKRGTPQNLACYIDHCMFVESVIADFMEFCQKAVDYKFGMGLSGTQANGGEWFIGTDWWKLMGKRKMRCVGAYGGAQIDIISSFKHPDDFVSQWAGGYDPFGKNEKHHRQGVWSLLLQGADGCNYGFAWGQILFPDLAARPHSKWVVEQVALIGKGGIGKLLKKAEKVQDGVAILYSQSSIHASRAFAMVRGGIPSMGSNWDGWVALLKALGIQYRFISYEQVEQGGLKDYRALIIPFGYVLSPSEKAQIERFARNGGTVIADVLNPEFGKMCGGADLQDLFGVEQIGMPTFKLTSLKGTNSVSQVKFMQGGDRITLKGAQAQNAFEDNAPAVVTKTIGKGKAVCLNLSIADYNIVSLGGTGGEESIVMAAQNDRKEAYEGLIQSILASAEIKPEITVQAAQTGKNLGAEIYRFKDGVVEYVGLMKPGSGPITEKDHKDARLNIGRKVHVYDVINKSYLGFTDKPEFEFVEGKVSLFALLPEKPFEIEIGLKGKYNAGEILEAPVTVKPALSGVALVSLTDGKGQERYNQQVALSDGKGMLQVPLALNDPAGSWRLTATDVATGFKAEKKFTLKGE